MIFRESDSLRRSVGDIAFSVLARGEKAMVVRFDFNAGEELPLHSHPHVQCGYVVSGKGRFSIGGKVETVVAGDSYYITGGVEHGLVVDEPMVVLDFFTPPREEYL